MQSVFWTLGLSPFKEHIIIFGNFIFEFLNNKIQKAGEKTSRTACSSVVYFQMVPVQQSDNKPMCEADHAIVICSYLFFSVPLRDTC